jgi:isoleucyl-tRNA synthetase
VLKQIYNKDLMYKGYTIQPYSPKAGTGLSSQVNQPEDYRDTTLWQCLESSRELLCSKFYDYISSKNLQHYKASVLDLDEIYFLAWTTTPWTLPSNTVVQNRLCFSKNVQYILFFNEFDFG